MRKLIAKLLVVAILLTTMSQTTVVNAQPIYELSENVYLSDGYEVTEKIESEWNDGYVATITIKNTSEVTIRNWSLYFPVNEGIENIWNVNIDACDDDWVLVTNLGWNENILPGESVSFGYVASSKFLDFSTDYILIEESTIEENNDVEEFVFTEEELYIVNNLPREEAYRIIEEKLADCTEEETVQSRSAASKAIKKAIKLVIKNKNKLVNAVGKYIGRDAAVAVGDVIHDLTPTLRKLLKYEDMGWDTVQGVCKSALISMGMKSSTAGTVAYYVRKGLEWVV